MTRGNAARLLIGGLAGVLGALAHFGLHRSLINDEAVELLVAEGLPLDRFYFFTPDRAYPRGLVDAMESFGPYVNHALLAVVAPWLTAREQFETPVRCLNVAAFTAACLVIFELARRQWGTGRAALLGCFLAGAGYALLMNQFLTRNSLSLIWAALALWTLERWLQKPSGGSAYRWGAGCAAALTAGCWTYTIFKPFALAVYAALVVSWLRFSQRPSELAPVAASAAAFAALLVGLVLLGGSSIPFYFQRGGYAIANAAQYGSNLALTLATPFYHRGYGPFVQEDVHVMIQRGTLSPLLWPFFAVGLAGGFAAGRPAGFVAATMWTIGMCACAIAGPNIKYQHAFFPLTLLLAAGGLFYVADRLPRGWQAIAAPVFLMFYLTLELWAVFKQFPTSDRFTVNRLPQEMARRGMEAARKSPGQVVLQPGLGIDLLNWYLWPPRDAGRVRVFSSPADLIAGLAAQPAPAPTLLLLDYPPESTYPALGWTPPGGLRIVNVREP